MLLTLMLSLALQPDLPTIVIDRDNIEIDRSCRVVVPEGLRIEDADGNGVVHVTASDITIEGVDGQCELIQHDKGTPWETIAGVAWRLDGVQNVTLRNIHAHRYKVAILATDCDGLTLEACDVAGGYAMRLGSTPQHEDADDWLWPHDNDEQQWRSRYGAGICVENSTNVTIRGCFARRRQNGIILDRVSDSKIYDNDMSFLSGWGLAMWRSSGNTISRNAFDLCIRGYSHGVYNRGQDSAGILMFEQCSGNVIAENSCTHSGDGIFAFAGRDALGQAGEHDAGDEHDRGEGTSHKRLGDNDNLFIANDLSFAAAHGLELTFSFNNRIFDNLFEGNSICGVWAGYSQETMIARNRFIENGGSGNGLERGGVDIEHGAYNTIRNNRFSHNAVGVRLWSDDDPDIRTLPWAKANYQGAIGTLITENRFERDDVAIELQDVQDTTIFANEFVKVRTQIDARGQSPIIRTGILSSSMAPKYTAIGSTRPVGGRDDTRGRQFIIMGEYFPWDFQAPMLRFAGREGDGHVWELFGNHGHLKISNSGTDDIKGTSLRGSEGKERIILSNPEPGVHPYRVRITVGDGDPMVAQGAIVNARWETRCFNWTIDPREDLDAWRKQAQDAPVRTIDALDLSFANAGPKDLDLTDDPDIASDHFGTIAKTHLKLPAGTWRFTTRSDDGVRVLVDGIAIIENWTWHGPTTDTATLTLDQPKEVEIVVEHFEIDGYAVLRLDIEPHIGHHGEPHPNP